MLSLTPRSRDNKKLFTKERRRNVAAVRRALRISRQVAGTSRDAAELGRRTTKRSRDREPAAPPSGACARNCEKWLLFEPLGAPKWLTKTNAKAYIRSLRRAAAWRDGASAKPLTVHTVTEHAAMLSWPCSCRRVEGRLLRANISGFRALGDLGCKAMGCKARRCAVRLFDKW